MNFNYMKYIFLLVFLLFIYSASYGQSKFRKAINKISYQDSTKFYNNKFWFTFHGGPSIGTNKFGPFIHVLGPGIDFNWIDKDYHYLKIKASLHFEYYLREIGWTSDLFQKSFEINFMTGKLIKANHTDLHSLTYGIGIIGGVRRGKLIEEAASGGGIIGLGIPAIYSEDPFFFIAIPLEYKFQSNWFGFGLDANLNPYLPYLGAKLFIQFRSKYYK